MIVIILGGYPNVNDYLNISNYLYISDWSSWLSYILVTLLRARFTRYITKSHRKTTCKSPVEFNQHQILGKAVPSPEPWQHSHTPRSPIKKAPPKHVPQLPHSRLANACVIISAKWNNPFSRLWAWAFPCQFVHGDGQRVVNPETQGKISTLTHKWLCLASASPARTSSLWVAFPSSAA